MRICKTFQRFKGKMQPRILPILDVIWQAGREGFINL
jgi:hypothetical protein